MEFASERNIISCEKINKQILDILRSPEKKAEPREMTLYTTTLHEASRAFIAGKFQVSSEKYRLALNLMTTVNIEKNDLNKSAIQYMLCITLLESDKLKDLQEALSLCLSLSALDHDNENFFPAAYCTLAKILMKFFRFDSALEIIRKGFTFLNKDVKCRVSYIPNTNRVIRESTKEGLMESLIKLKSECSDWRRPDAVCNMAECKNYIHPYPPNRNIFFRDPTFTSMVTVICSNPTFPCTLKFHQACWEYKKESMSKHKVLTDEDMIGYKCLTPNCRNERVSNKIVKIEVFKKDGSISEVVTNMPLLVMPVEDEPSECPTEKESQRSQQTRISNLQNNNVIEKSTLEQMLTTMISQTNRFDRDISWRLKKLEVLRKNNFDLTMENNWQPDKEMYGNEYMTMASEAIPYPDFSKETLETAQLKSFLFSLLYEYIKTNGPVDIKEVITKWNDTKTIVPNLDSIFDSYLDVKEFLLQSPKISMVENYICIPEMLPQVYDLLKSDTIKKFGDVVNTKDTHINRNGTKMTIPTLTNGSVQSSVQVQAKNSIESVAKCEKTEMQGSANFQTNPFINQNSTNNMQQPATQFSSAVPLYQSANVNQEPLTDQAVNLKYASNSQQKSVNGNFGQPHSSENVCSKNEVDIEEIDRLKSMLRRKDLMIEQLRTENEILLKGKVNMQTMYSNLLDEYNKSQNDLLVTKSNITSLLQEKNDSTYNINLLLKEKGAIENIYKENYETLLKKSEANEEQLKLKEKELDALKSMHFYTKQTMLKKILDCQYSANNNFLMRNIYLCSIVIDTINKINYIYERNAGYKNFLPDAVEWTQSLKGFHSISSDHHRDYLKLQFLLASREEVEARDDVALILNNIPCFPSRLLSDIVYDAFNNYATCMQQILQHTIAHREAFSRSQFIAPPPRGITLGYANNNSITTNYNNLKLKVEPEPKDIPKDSTDAQNNVTERTVLKVDDGQAKILTGNCETDINSGNDGGENAYLEKSVERVEESCSNNGKKDILQDGRQIKSLDTIMYNLRMNYPGLMDLDLLEGVMNVKRDHGNCLTGIPVNVVVQEAGKHILKRQRKYLCHYKTPVKSNAELHKSSANTKVAKQQNSATSKLAGKKSGKPGAGPSSEIFKKLETTVHKSQKKRLNSASSDTTDVSVNSKPKSAPSFSLGKSVWNQIVPPNDTWNKENLETECIICMENMSNSKSLYALTCKHTFHKVCIKDWFNHNQSCPTCRVHCTIDDEYPPLPS